MGSRRGFTIIAAAFIILAAAVLSIGVSSFAASEAALSAVNYNSFKAFHIANAGVEFGLGRLGVLSDWSSPPSAEARSFGGGYFTVSFQSTETDGVLAVNAAGIFTAEGRTFSRSLQFNSQKSVPRAFKYAVFYSNSMNINFRLYKTNVEGNVFFNANAAINSPSAVNNGYVRHPAGTTVGGSGIYSAEEAPAPSLPTFDNSYYDNLIDEYDNLWAGGVSDWTFSSGTYALNGETLVKKNVNIKGTGKIVGHGTIAANGSLSVYENASVTPDPGKQIVLVGKEWVKIYGNAVINDGTHIFSKNNSTLIHNANVRVYGSLIMSKTKVDIYDNAAVSRESTVYLPPTASGKESVVFELEDDSVFNGTLLADTAPGKKVRIEDSSFTGLVYTPRSEVEINESNLYGTIFADKFKNNEITESSLVWNSASLPSSVSSDFKDSGEGSISVSGWQEIY